MAHRFLAVVLRTLACIAPLGAALAVSPSALGQDILDLEDDEHGHYVLHEEELTPTPGQMTEEAALAKRDFDGNRWLEAALALDRVVRGETGDDDGNRQIAQYQVAITLYNLRFYNASLGIFRDIADNPNHNKFKETLLWLARLAIGLPEPANVVELVGRYSRDEELEYSRSAQQQNLRWQLAYLWGRARYRNGSLEDAVQAFAAVDKRSPYFRIAKIWEGASSVRLGKAAPALRALDQASSAVDGKDDENSVRLRALAELSMGRVLYSSAIHGKGPSDASVDGRRLTAAIAHYDRVPESEYRQDALVEAGWAHYMAGDFSRSLGALTAARAPSFGSTPRPEADRLEVLLSYATCRYDSASTRIVESRRAREPDRKAIADLLQRVRDDDRPGELFSWARAARASGDVAKPLAKMLSGRIVHHLEYVATIEREQALLRKSPASLRDSDLGSDIADELDLQRALAVSTAEAVLLEDLEALAKEYRTHDAELTHMADVIGEKKPGAGRAPGQLAGVFRPARDPDAIQWPFDGEYWKDEIGSYQAVVISQCR